LGWGPPKPADDTEQPPFKFHRTVFFDLDRDDAGAVDRELHNLAISAGSRDERLAQFREQQKLSGASDEDTVAEVRGVRVAGTELPDSGEETA
jgi:hypothetical protein